MRDTKTRARIAFVCYCNLCSVFSSLGIMMFDQILSLPSEAGDIHPPQNDELCIACSTNNICEETRFLIKTHEDLLQNFAGRLQKEGGGMNLKTCAQFPTFSCRLPFCLVGGGGELHYCYCPLWSLWRCDYHRLKSMGWGRIALVSWFLKWNLKHICRYGLKTNSSQEDSLLF